MKLRGAHIIVLVAVAVVALLVYGGARMAGQAPGKQPGEDQFLEEIRQIAPTAPSTEEGNVPPLAQADQVPKIELEPAGDVEMGTIRNDGNTTREIKVHNNGKATLKITRITTGCGCTQAKMEEKDKTIEPGAFSPLSITINPAKIASGFESRKSVTLNSNDPATPALKFDVIVKVNPEYLLEPAQVAFGTVEKGKPHEQTVLLRQLTDEPIEIKNMTSMARNQALELSNELRPKEQWADPNKAEYNIHVKLAASVPLGPFSGRFTIVTTCKRRGEVPVPVTAIVTSWYSITPARMLVLRQAPGMGQDDKARAVITADRPFEITDIVPTIEGLVAEVQPGDGPNSKAIHLSLDTNAKPRGKIEYLNFNIKSGDEVMKEVLEVRVIPAAIPGAPGRQGKRPLINLPQMPFRPDGSPRPKGMPRLRPLAPPAPETTPPAPTTAPAAPEATPPAPEATPPAASAPAATPPAATPPAAPAPAP
ncbi:MAG: DUF1573 domain-containing protein [Candidatus Hydrogenedentes bacterium]|nr:DUF1573 domain-containing protein [Candidatus Hydrogenedentota bacterium]